MKVMIPQPIVNQQQPDWQQALRGMITDPITLLTQLELSEKDIAFEWNREFPLRVTQSFVDRMNKKDPNDPLLRQVLSHPKESQPSIFSSPDPLQENKSNPVPGLLHKFANRVLLTFTSSCAIHCRYCFRRHFPYEKNNPGSKGWHEALNYIAQRPEIIEVILSGGDPLMAQDHILAAFLEELSAISHVKLLRIHTRLPVVIPSRIQPNLVNILANPRFNTTVVYHVNHANELTTEIKAGVSLLKQQGITVLNMGVLLKDINDDPACLKALCLALHDHGILPYYMNLLDNVQGAFHFFVSRDKAKTLQEHLRNELPGYLVPKFVQEVPHFPSKVPLDQLP